MEVCNNCKAVIRHFPDDPHPWCPNGCKLSDIYPPLGVAPMQGIRGIEDVRVVCISKAEIAANFRVASWQAERDRMPGTAERIMNDANYVESLPLGTWVKLV